MTMVVRIVKNQTLNPITLGDLGIIIPASGQVDLGLSCDSLELSNSDDLSIQLGNGNLLLNIGDEDIPYPRSIDIIRNIPQQFKTTTDQKLIVNATPQPGTMTDFVLTSRTDSQAGIGGLLHVDHTVFQYGQEEQSVSRPCGLFVDNGNENELSKYWLNTIYLDFDVLNNRTFFFDGGVMWRGLADNGANGMMALNLEAVSSTFDAAAYETTPGAGNAALVDGYLLVPMPGLTGGTHDLPLGQPAEQTPQNIKMTGVAPMVMTGKYYSPAFWQFDYNVSDGTFFNLLPTEDPYTDTRDTTTSDPSVIRVYGNLFAAEIPLMAFVKDFLLIGNSSNFFGIASPDATEIPYGVRMKLDCKTIVYYPHTNVAWTLVGYIKTYREHTV